MGSGKSVFFQNINYKCLSPFGPNGNGSTNKTTRTDNTPLFITRKGHKSPLRNGVAQEKNSVVTS